ncbi:phage tail tape measure protein, TP901 family, partial [Escherichia coli 90.0039]
AVFTIKIEESWP